MSRIAFLGAGNMASAMVEGLLATGSIAPAHLSCLSGTGGSAARLAARTGIRLATDLADLCETADAIVIAFKPQHLAQADARLAALTRGRLVISVLAGRRLETLALVFPHARNLVRTMPNTPGQIGAGITGWCAQQPLTPADSTTLLGLLGALGKAVEVPEGDLDALTAVSGSGPAYVFEFAAALREAGISAGLTPVISERLAIETLLGAARLLARKGAPPEVLRDQVTSPNGTTCAGLQQMKAGDFRGLIARTVAAAAARSRELSRGS
jgi:pyrroline-5-carboxylate reductase